LTPRFASQSCLTHLPLRFCMNGPRGTEQLIFVASCRLHPVGLSSSSSWLRAGCVRGFVPVASNICLIYFLNVSFRIFIVVHTCLYSFRSMALHPHLDRLTLIIRAQNDAEQVRLSILTFFRAVQNAARCNLHLTQDDAALLAILSGMHAQICITIRDRALAAFTLAWLGLA
jgi:hypothetical protein